MKIKKILFRKLFTKSAVALLLSVLLAFNPVVLRLVMAQEEGQTETAQEVQSPDGVQAESEGEGEGDSSITTGDAESTAEVETTANTHEDTVEGEITTPDDSCTPPEGETECPDGIEISNDNSADVGDEAGSSATTGDNEITGSSGDAEIDTGDATASASIDNEINTNTVIFEDEEEVGIEETEELGESEEGEGESAEEVGESLGEDPDVIIENENEGNLTNQADVLADTGENLANDNGGDATIGTGDALAYANLVNLLNTNVVGSNFELAFANYLEGLEGDVDFNEVWKEILAKSFTDGLSLTGEDLALFLIENSNLASLLNDVDVAAISGGNEASGNAGSAAVDTGDATALANVVNFINLNLFGSQFFFGVVNIAGSFVGNLILPRPELFLQDGDEVEIEGDGGGQSVVFSNQNEVRLEGEVSTYAETGSNATDGNFGDSLIESGNALAQTNTFSIVNTTIQRNNWFFLIINHLGSWVGSMFGWSSPDAEEVQEGQDSVIFQLGFNPGSEAKDVGGQTLPLDGGPQSVINNRNQAEVINDINVSASTGQNQANENLGGASIRTGNASALANLFNFVNLNILGGRWFFGLVNILGDWQGDAVFAYPDVAVELSDGGEQVAPGETYEYALNFANKGYEVASNVSLALELPEGVNYVGDSSGQTPGISGNTYIWNMGSLEPGEVGFFNIVVQLNSDFSPEEPISFWPKLVREVHAAEGEETSQIVASASIAIVDPESDFSNNSSSATTTVYFPSNEPGGDQRQPVLEISAWNNVNDFVYPGDVVTFEITIKNTSDVPSYNTRLIQGLYNGVPGDFGKAEFDLGTIKPGEGGTLTFGLALEDNGFLPEDHYYTIAQAFGTATNGNEVSSNEARTDFDIKYKQAFSPLEVLATTKEDDVLAAVDSCPKGEVEENILPYVLLLLLSSMYIAKRTRPKLKLK